MNCGVDHGACVTDCHIVYASEAASVLVAQMIEQLCELHTSAGMTACCREGGKLRTTHHGVGMAACRELFNSR